MDQDAWMLPLTAVAAVGGITGTWLLAWTWTDRPQVGWGIRHEADLDVEEHHCGTVTYRVKSFTEHHQCRVWVNAQGTATAYGIQVRLVGCRLLNADRGMTASRMTADSDPIEFTVDVPAGEAPALVEIIWIQLRPRRRMGQRVDLRRLDEPDWHWKWRWRSLRPAGWHRLQRTQGLWVEHRTPARPEIPETDPTTLESTGQ